jgi:prepilin-type processing-associated H-X9-DG protein
MTYLGRFLPSGCTVLLCRPVVPYSSPWLSSSGKRWVIKICLCLQLLVCISGVEMCVHLIKSWFRANVVFAGGHLQQSAPQWHNP